MEPKYNNQFDLTFDLYKEWAKNPIGRFDSLLRVRKDSFILGNADDFREFINYKIFQGLSV